MIMVKVCESGTIEYRILFKKIRNMKKSLVKVCESGTIEYRILFKKIKNMKKKQHMDT